MRTKSLYHRKARLGVLPTGVLALCALWAVAGDVTTDNLTVNRDATFWGNVTVKDASQGSAPTNGLVLYYSLNTNTTPVADGSGCGNTGTVSGATWVTNGITGGAYSMTADGNDSIAAAYNSTLKLGNNGTVSLWLYPTTISGGTKMLASYTDGTYAKSWLLFCNAGNLYTDWKSGSGMPGYSSLPVGAWHHIALVNSNGTVRLYVDGNQSGSAGTSGGAVTDNFSMYLGRAASWLSPGGRIDEVRIYNRALTAAEVQGLYLYDAHLTTGAVRFELGVSYVKPVGDLPMGNYTNSP